MILNDRNATPALRGLSATSELPVKRVAKTTRMKIFPLFQLVRDLGYESWLS